MATDPPGSRALQVTRGAPPLAPIRVQDRTGRTGHVVCFYDDPAGALIAWDSGHFVRLPARKFADLTAYHPDHAPAP